MAKKSEAKVGRTSWSGAGVPAGQPARRPAADREVRRTISTATLVLVGLVATLSAHAATFGRMIPLIGGATDIALDEARQRLYLTSSVAGLVQVYSFQRSAFQAPIAVDQTPIALAMSRDGKQLYVTCYDASTLDVIDLDSLAVVSRVGLPARPQGVAVGRDGRVLISTSGSGTGGLTNVLLLYDPRPNPAVLLTSITVTPQAAGAPIFPPPSGRPYLSTRSRLAASRDGSKIAGVNVPLAGPPSVYVVETSSATVLRARTIAGPSIALSISDDGSRIQAGTMLFDSATLQILAIQNAANVPYPIDPAANFGLQANQGGSVFAPDGQTLFESFNIAPLPAVAGNPISQLMLNDPDNLLTRLGVQLPENLAGKIVMSSDGANAYAISDSGFVILPLSTLSRSAIAAPGSGVVLLARDACGVTQSATATLTVNNPGTGRVTANALLLQLPGQPNQASPATAPTARATPGPSSAQITFTFNNAAARGPGSITPPHDFMIQSPEAVNIPDRVRVFENNRDPDARGTVLPIQTGSTANGGLTDLLYDQSRQRIYIANAGMNRVEVYDIRQQRFLTPIKVGQLPVSMALTMDAATLYVSNAGGEVISIVDPDRLVATGRVTFPAAPFNSNLALALPNIIASSQAGTMFLMTSGANGALWKIAGNAAAPRGVSKVIGQTNQGQPANIPVPSFMSSTPGGEFIFLATGTGFAYLYDASVDDFVAGRQVAAGAQPGYIGPITAGPRGQYFVFNGTVLNQSLVAGVARPGLVSAVAAVGNTTFALFSPPPAAAPNAAPTVAPTIQIVDANTGQPGLAVSALEGPLTQIAGAARGVVQGRTMAVDGANAYVLTTSGLSIIPITPVTPADRPQPAPRGTVNLGSYQTQIAPNGLISIFGQNLAAQETAPSLPLPMVLGGVCVTLNNVGLPLFYASPTQINAQIPPNLAAGNFPLVVRSIARQTASLPQQIAVSQYAPAVLVDGSGTPLVFHADGVQVSKDNPAERDEPLVMYAVGLGATHGGAVTPGAPAPASPLAETTGDVKVYFGNPLYKQSEVIVDFSGLTPGFVGLYQLNLRVPGFHEKGEALPVSIHVGSVSSPASGPVVPLIAVD